MPDLSELNSRVHQNFEALNQAREQALLQARQLTRLCANTIRALHRSEMETAHQNLEEAGGIAAGLQNLLGNYPVLLYAGYTQDALKEYVEASLTCAIIEDAALPSPEDLKVEYSTYLNGMAEVTGELRRRCLDILRQGYSEEAERLLGWMDEIYNLLVTVDYPDALTGGLRRQTDLVRGIVERTRADLTLSLREERLQKALERALNRLPEEPLNP
ncbi:predicted RNA-binding protein of the translin family [Bellilinea caldifistulae]|uniref:Haloacid dehalogenase n=1 Tax=Bellilinea caldifistulae TaxID=360411 RepID=A0A0P6X2A3_9CHLR|nr:haloacid dehalogenase [Bellilinea caldifistulae]KPL76708.1 haloacid dehalogenase [Bellilinea caldifistulae]GAP08900.1 predicted RNA-binding protein of the translin family [Bellilinea caldifistulae]